MKGTEKQCCFPISFQGCERLDESVLSFLHSHSYWELLQLLQGSCSHGLRQKPEQKYFVFSAVNVFLEMLPWPSRTRAQRSLETTNISLSCHTLFPLYLRECHLVVHRIVYLLPSFPDFPLGLKITRSFMS